MSFHFYPKHEFACRNLGHCPHLGGAALATLVMIANSSDQSAESSRLTIRGLEQRNAVLSSQIVSLQTQLDQVKLELKIERQNKFATNRQKQAEAEPAPTAGEQATTDQPAKKHGAPVGHPGWFRKTPTEYDWDLDVAAPSRCPHCNGAVIHFQFDTTRAGVVSRDLLGEHFTGTLVTDCYSGYHAHVAGAKQKCLAHIARTARDWQKLTEKDSIDYVFFENVREFVSRGCKFYHLRKGGKLLTEEQENEKTWLEERLQVLTTCDVSHEKAITLQGRLLRHYSEWLVFAEDPRVPPTNNLAERALRPLVVLRKITFGHRSEAGGMRLATLMTVGETSRRHDRRASDIYYELLTRPPTKVLQGLYAGR